MRVMKGHRIVSAFSCFMLIAVVSGCAAESAGPASVAESVVRGVPETWTGPELDLLNGTPAVGWLSDDEFGVVTIGSSACPPVATSLEVVGAADLRVDFVGSPNDTCSADMGATTHVFRLPGDIDQRPVTVTLSFTPEDRYPLFLP